MSFAATQDGFEKSPSQEADVSGAVSDMILRSFGGKSLVILAVPDMQHLEIRTVSDLKHQANVPCATEPVRLEASQNPADPRVYYLPKNSGRSSVSSVCLRTRRDHGLAIPETKKFAISPTGNSIYTTDSKRVSHHPKSATVFPSILVNGFGNDPPQFRLYARQSVDVMDHQPLPDPYGRGLVRVNHNDTPASLVLRDGLTVLNIGFGSDQREMSMSVREGRGMPVSLRARNAKSVSDYPVEVALTRVPWATDRGMPGFREKPEGWTVLADESRNRIVCIHDGIIHLVDPKELAQTTDRIPLTATLNGPVYVSAGQVCEYSVNCPNPNATIRFTALPEDAVNENGHIKWTPSVNQAGVHKIDVKLTEGKEEQRLSFPIVVRTPSIELPFTSTAMAVEHEGPRIAVWRTERLGQPGNWTPRQLEVIDTKTGKRSSQGDGYRLAWPPDTKNVWGDESGLIVGDWLLITGRHHGGLTIYSLKAPSDPVPFSVSDGVQAVAAVGDIILIQQPETIKMFSAEDLSPIGAIPKRLNSSTIAFETTRLGPAVSGLVVNRDLQPQQVMSSSLQHLFSHLNWQQPTINVRDRQLPEKPSVPNAATMTSSASNDRFFPSDARYRTAGHRAFERLCAYTDGWKADQTFQRVR